MTALTLRAPAKLNLFLHVLGKRADGYHEIESLVAFTELADRLNIDYAETLSLTVEGEFAREAGSSADNLVLKAARLLQARLSKPQGAKLTLTKNIPVGAGLGGGSADAAAALRGLNRLWDLQLSKEELHAIALELGADVAMCLDHVPAMARGIGEQLTPLKASLPILGIVLVHPRSMLPTPAVYAAFRPSQPLAPWQKELSSLTAFLTSLKPTRNQLQAAAISVNPDVAEVLLELEMHPSAPALVRMTGSGACCFALYTTPALAQKAAQTLHKQHPHWWVHTTGFFHSLG